MDFEEGREYSLKGQMEHMVGVRQEVPSAFYIRDEKLKFGGLWHLFACVSDHNWDSNPFLGRVRICSSYPIKKDAEGHVETVGVVYTRDIWEQEHGLIVSGFLLKIQELLDQGKLPRDNGDLFRRCLEKYAKPEFLAEAVA